MSRKKKVKEIVLEPQAALVPAIPSPSASLQAVIEGMVRKRVDELLASSGMAEMGDSFRPAEVAKVRRRINHIFESQKWRKYFEKWGCLICGKVSVPYSFNGLCGTCGNRTTSRLMKIKRDFEAAHPDSQIERNIDQLTLRARAAEDLLLGFHEDEKR